MALMFCIFTAALLVEFLEVYFANIDNKTANNKLTFHFTRNIIYSINLVAYTILIINALDVALKFINYLSRKMWDTYSAILLELQNPKRLDSKFICSLFKKKEKKSTKNQAESNEKDSTNSPLESQA